MAYRDLASRSPGVATDIRACVPEDVGVALEERDSDDLAREVYCLLGIPVDVVDMAGAVRRIESAIARRKPYLLSTPNLNFLITSRRDEEFRSSLLASDLCPADGVPIVWMARLLGAPKAKRVAGSDIFEALKASARGPKVFLFGGPEGAAALAGERLNAETHQMRCVGTYYPGFCAPEEMATDAVFETINDSGADLLAVALGAHKGQAWLLRNHDRLSVPVRVHLGAVINFQAGTVPRAPQAWRRFGLEWLWRIRQEPQLWRRYWADSRALLQLTLKSLLPLLAFRLEQRMRRPAPLEVTCVPDRGSNVLKLRGDATASFIEAAREGFRVALARREPVVIDFASVRLIDARFLGLVLMLRKTLDRRDLTLRFTGLNWRIETYLRLQGLSFLVDQRAGATHVGAIRNGCKN